MISIVISIAALVIAVLSWVASDNSVRAAMFDRRFEILRDVERYISRWMIKGVPDMNDLHGALGAACNRSRYISDPNVVAYIEQLIRDGAQAHCLRQMIDIETDKATRDHHIGEELELKKKYHDFSKLYPIFKKDLCLRPDIFDFVATHVPRRLRF